MTLNGVKGRNDRKSGASTRGVSESCWFCCRPHRRIFSESDRGSALSGPDELEIPRPCGIHVPSVAYQVEARLVLQLAVIRFESGQRTCLYGAVSRSAPRNTTSHNGHSDRNRARRTES